ncbi:MAG: hypothetical protein ACLTDF_04745 [Coprococcus sp.]
MSKAVFNKKFGSDCRSDVRVAVGCGGSGLDRQEVQNKYRAVSKVEFNTIRLRAISVLIDIGLKPDGYSSNDYWYNGLATRFRRSR